jgi:hypothetical protein
MPRPVGEVDVRIVQDDFSGGIGSRISPVGVRGSMKWLKDAMNIWFRPKRAISVMQGSRDLSNIALTEKPTSIWKHYASGATRLFVATDNGTGGGNIFRFTPSVHTVQTLPGFTATNAKWHFEQANAITIGCQRANAGRPMFWRVDNPDNVWHSLVLPKPTTAITFNADSVGGFLTDTKIYFWRYRWRYRNGSSLASPASASNTMNTPNLTANLIIPLPGTPRSDYLGWTLERSDQNGSAAGPFYFVADGTAGTYADGLADSSLGYRSREDIHGEPVAMNGVIYHKKRLFGWSGSTMYVSQLTEDEEGTGLCNWIGDLTYDIDKDDGDEIQTCVKQVDRLLIGKRNSLHVIEGDDVDSFRVRTIFAGAGPSGQRAICSVGPTAFFYAGIGRLFVARGDRVEPWLSAELGDQLEQINTAYDADVLAKNWRGQAILFCCRFENSDAQRDWIGWDLEMGTPIRANDPPAIDALVQKDEADFNSASLIVADPTFRPADEPSGRPFYGVMLPD